MVWKINEQIQRLPVSNKAAYRRSIMEVQLNVLGGRLANLACR